MRTPDKYFDAAEWFAPDQPQSAEVATELHKWVRAQAEHVRSLCPTKRLRCFALLTCGRSHPHMINVEFAAPDDSYRVVTIQCSGRHEVRDNVPQTINLAAGVKLLALLTDELKVTVKLQT
jgi:hypothetical protein